MRAVAVILGLCLAAGNASAEGDDLGKALAAAVDLPTRDERLAAAAKLAERNDVTLDAWLAAMRGFGEFQRVAPGSRSETAWLVVAGVREAADIALHIPPGYDPRRRAPLLVAFHGTGGEGHDEDELWAEAADQLGMIVVAPTDPTADLGYKFSEVERWRALAALRWARRRFNVDENRVYATGVSRGGHLTWDVALRHPDSFAALVPMIGGPRLQTAEGQNNLRYVESVAHLPIRDLQGSKDDPLLLLNLRMAFKRLAACGAKDAKLVEFPDMAHDFDPHAVDWKEFLGAARRDPTPRRVVRTCARPDEARSAWVEATSFGPAVKEVFRADIKEKKVDAMNEDQKREWLEAEADRRTARIEATTAGPGMFAVKTSLVMRYRLLLPQSMLDADGPVEVTTNGKTARYEAKPSKLVLLREFVERFDRTFLPTVEISGP